MQAKELQAIFTERGIRRVKLGGFDIDGVLRGKYVSLEKFWSSVEKGFGFCDVIFGWDIGDQLYDNAAVTGWHTGYPDTLARIDLDTFRILPSEPTTAHLLVDFWLEPGKPHPACPRNLLKTVIARAQAAGFRPKMSLEFEYWLFRETPQSMREKGYRNLQPLSPGMFGYSWVRQGQHVDFIEDVMEQMGAYGIEIEAMHTETGPGVYETAIKYTDALEAADQAALFKTTMKILCTRHGCTPTFMAKWSADMPGSSGHMHQSLWNQAGDKNVFTDAKGPNGLSEVGQRYLAGLLALSTDFTALYSPTVNSYKRYVPGMWAPLSPSWDLENRTCSVRLINQPGASSTRLELRQTAADINPYIAVAAALASGLWGIERAMDPPPPVRGDASAGKDRFPQSLGAAAALLQSSSRAREVLPESFIDHYVRTREWEARQHQKSVSHWELDRYFEII